MKKNKFRVLTIKPTAFKTWEELVEIPKKIEKNEKKNNKLIKKNRILKNEK